MGGFIIVAGITLYYCWKTRKLPESNNGGGESATSNNNNTQEKSPSKSNSQVSKIVFLISYIYFPLVSFSPIFKLNSNLTKYSLFKKFLNICFATMQYSSLIKEVLLMIKHSKEAILHTYILMDIKENIQIKIYF